MSLDVCLRDGPADRGHMEGGIGGVQLLAEDDRVERALKVLGDA